MPSEEPLVLFRRAPKGLPRRDLATFAAGLQEQLAKGAHFCCLITDDRELQRLNLQFRGKNYPTDVLSFPSESPQTSLGDIAISAQRAAAQAAEFGHPEAEEIKILMLHGVLHLLGFDHERDRGKMAKAENLWRRKLALPSALIERAKV
jgi:probable rRNA maturation factor